MIAKGAAPLVLSPLVGTAACMALALLLEAPAFLLPGLPLGVAFLVLLTFFRDPERTPGPGFVSAADGRVLEVDPAAGRVAVFMGLANVHVNRAPVDGRIARMTHAPGGHAPAYRSKARQNERLETLIETAHGPVRVLQVAGIVARRIVPFRSEGDRVKKGQRIGMIRFGSRVEMTFPKGVRIVVHVGDRVRAGETTVAEVARGVAR